jgi:hypothetical protein
MQEAKVEEAPPQIKQHQPTDEQHVRQRVQRKAQRLN